MLVDQPDLRQIRTFLAVADELNFTRAAERLHLAQQAVSAQIRTLEADLGVRLLDRTSRRVTLTSAGRTFRDGARTALRALDETTQRTREVAQGIRGQVRAAHTTAVAWRLLPATVDALKATAPGLAFDSSESVPVDILDALRNGRIDLALGVEILPCGRGLTSRVVWREPWLIGVPADDPLAREDVISLADLADRDWVNWPRETHPGYWKALHAVTAQAGFTPRVQPARIGIADYVRAINAGAVGLAPASTLAHPLPGVVIRPSALATLATHAVVWNTAAPPAALDHVLAALTEAAHVLAGRPEDG